MDAPTKSPTEALKNASTNEAEIQLQIEAKELQIEAHELQIEAHELQIEVLELEREIMEAAPEARTVIENAPKYRVGEDWGPFKKGEVVAYYPMKSEVVALLSLWDARKATDPKRKQSFLERARENWEAFKKYDLPRRQEEQEGNEETTDANP